MSDEESEAQMEVASLEYFFSSSEWRKMRDDGRVIRVRIVPESERVLDDDDGDDAVEELGSTADMKDQFNEGRFLYLDITLPDGYPEEEALVLSMEDPHNHLLPKPHRLALLASLREAAQGMVGGPMIIALVSQAREELDELKEEFRSLDLWEGDANDADEPPGDSGAAATAEAVTQPKAAKLTKKEKNRQMMESEKTEGWDWVDILSHLSKKPR